MKRKHDNLCLWVFAILALNGKDLRPLILSYRPEKLDAFMKRMKSGLTMLARTGSMAIHDPERKERNRVQVSVTRRKQSVNQAR